MKLLAALFLLVQTSQAFATDLVFDLDWTLIYSTRAASAESNPEGIVRYQDEIYRFSDEAAKVILTLHRTPGMRISFFSGGDHARNEFVIEKLYEEINRLNGTPNQTLKPFRVGSADDLRVLSSDPLKRFSERHKKPLRRLIPDIDLTDAILIDDSDFADAGEEKNLLRILDTLDDIPDFSSNEWKTAGLQELPKNRTDWSLERQKLVWVLGVVTEAKRLTQNTGVTFTEAVNQMTRNSLDAPITRDLPSYKAQVEKGLKALNPRCDDRLK